MRISIIGALIGAMVGAIARSAVVLYMVGATNPVVFYPSAMIGVLIGAIAGAIARPLWSAVLGAVLSGFIFELFMLPCATLVGTWGKVMGKDHAQSDFLSETLPHMLLMALAGALAGGIGALAARMKMLEEPQEETDSDSAASPSSKPPDERRTQ